MTNFIDEIELELWLRGQILSQIAQIEADFFKFSFRSLVDEGFFWSGDVFGVELRNELAQVDEIAGANNRVTLNDVASNKFGGETTVNVVADAEKWGLKHWEALRAEAKNALDAAGHTYDEATLRKAVDQLAADRIGYEFDSGRTTKYWENLSAKYAVQATGKVAALIGTTIDVGGIDHGLTSIFLKVELPILLGINTEINGVWYQNGTASHINGIERNVLKGIYDSSPDQAFYTVQKITSLSLDYIRNVLGIKVTDTSSMDALKKSGFYNKITDEVGKFYIKHYKFTDPRSLPGLIELGAKHLDDYSELKKISAA